MEFYIGQTFEGGYPPKAAEWCDKNNARIKYTGETKEITVQEEYTVIVEEVREYTVEEEQVNKYGETVLVPVTKTDIVPVEKTEIREVQKTVRIFKIVENPPPPKKKMVRTFSKFNIWVATQNIPMTLPDGTASSVWTAFESFLKNEKMKNGDTLYSGWMNLNDLVEDNPFFEQFYPMAVDAFGKELVDNVLAASVTSTKEVVVE